MVIYLYNDRICNRQWLASGKAEQHRKAGRRVLYADAEDPGFWSHLDLYGVEVVVLSMPEMEAKLIATRQLRKRGFAGLVRLSLEQRTAYEATQQA